MRSALFCLPILAPLLSACAGSPVGDAIAGPEKLAQQDDAYCRSIGAQGDAYTNCRMFMTHQRDQRHTARLGMAMDALSPPRGPQTCVIVNSDVNTALSGACGGTRW